MTSQLISVVYREDLLKGFLFLGMNFYKARMEQLKEGYESALRDQKFAPN